MKEVQKYITSREDEFLERLFVLLRQKSISAQNIGINETSELLKNKMKEIGISTKFIPTVGHPIVYGEIMDDPDNFTLLIYGHYDVQPPDPIDEWLSPPFEPTIRDGRIYCRGAGDNKGQLMAQLFAVETYLNIYGKLPINIKFVFEGEEENGSPNIASFVEENKDLLKADLVYTSDGPMHESGRPFVLLGVRGILSVELNAKGGEWDNHSGNKGNIVPNPAWELINLLKTMRDEHGNILIEGFYDDIQEPTEQEIKLLEELPYDQAALAKEIGYQDLSMSGKEYYHKLTYEPTMNIAGFTSGYGGEGTKTIIPATAMVKMDMRLVMDQDPEDIFEKFERHVAKIAPNVDVTNLGMMAPSRTLATLKVVDTIKSAVEKAYEVEPIMQPGMGGSLPDYVWTKILNTPSVVVPYANFDEANHSPNENIGLKNFFDGILCTCQVIEELGNEHSD